MSIASAEAVTASDTPIAIELNSVGVRFVTDRGIVTALQDINLRITEGSFTSLIGPSGCGKSTLLRVAADIIKPTTGSVKILGRSAEEARKNREIGFVFQDPSLLPWRTVLENVLLPMELGGDMTPSNAGDPYVLIKLVGLAGWENAMPHELSGGMRQRVSIARALISAPRMLLMDEPFGALDEITRDRLNEELLRIWETTGTTVLFVTHSLYEAAFLGQQVLLLAAHPGRIRDMSPVNLASPRDLSMRELPEFMETITKLRGILETC
ncbi:ABC transporter ATP-binding protein [Hoeflea sp. CAU 1731]